MRRFGSDEIKAAAEVLKQDGCIAAATDTVFGVCARISEEGMNRLYEVKNRPRSKQFPIMCADVNQLRTVAEVSDMADTIIQAFMPGPLTVILKAKESVPAAVRGGGSTLAIRLATSSQLKQLIEAVGTPLFMTSANQSGMPECRTEEEIEVSCPKLDGILEGTVFYNRASTIADLTGETPKILREGPITIEQMNQALRRKTDD